MHVQGGQRGSKLATPGDIVHEGNGVHEYEVVSASFHHVVLRHKATGEEGQYTKLEFNEMFEY